MGLTGPWSSSQELPEQWDNVKKMAIAVRQQVAPLQANEVAALRQRCSAFDVEQRQFWERFRKEAPFRYGPHPPPPPCQHSLLSGKHGDLWVSEGLSVEFLDLLTSSRGRLVSSLPSHLDRLVRTWR